MADGGDGRRGSVRGKPAVTLAGLAALVVAAALAYLRAGSAPTAPPPAPVAAPVGGPGAGPAAGPVSGPRAGGASPAAGPAPAVPPAPGAGRGEVRVGSWNIEWLGRPEDRSGAGKGVAQDPADLADYIVAAGVDVLGLCEITTPVRGTPVRSREIEAAIDALRARTGAAWGYVLFPGKQEGDQLTGVMWNAGVVTPVAPGGGAWTPETGGWRVPMETRRRGQPSLWARAPHAMKFSCGAGRTDFVLIVVHMKADYNGDFSAQRREEAELLVAALPEVRRAFGDQDVLVAGDTNCTGEREPAILALEAAGLADLNAAGRPTHWRGGSMDRVLVPKDQPEFRGRAFEVESDVYLRKRGIDAREFKRRFSDHYLVETAITVMADDD